MHRTTVSLAMKGHPSIPEATRRRIMEIAEALGYAPDPMLSALAVYRNSNRPAHFHGTLAWLVDQLMVPTWRRNLHFKEYFAGATRQARYHGYELEVFNVNTPDMPSRRLASVLRARNIVGILLCPQRKPHTRLVFPFEDFCAVTFGYSLEDPKLHTVAGAHYSAIRQTIREVRRRGYRRIGFVGLRGNDSKLDNTHLAAYLAEDFLSADGGKVRPLYEEAIDSSMLASWFRRNKPDAFITSHPSIMELLKNTGIVYPKVGIGYPGLPGPNAELCGITEESAKMGAVAVDFLVSMIQHGRRGLPLCPQRLLVEGLWNEGKSLHPAK